MNDINPVKNSSKNNENCKVFIVSSITTIFISFFLLISTVSAILFNSPTVENLLRNLKIKNVKLIKIGKAFISLTPIALFSSFVFIVSIVLLKRSLKNFKKGKELEERVENLEKKPKTQTLSPKDIAERFNPIANEEIENQTILFFKSKSEINEIQNPADALKILSKLKNTNFSYDDQKAIYFYLLNHLNKKSLYVKDILNGDKVFEDSKEDISFNIHHWNSGTNFKVILQETEKIISIFYILCERKPAEEKIENLKEFKVISRGFKHLIYNNLITSLNNIDQSKVSIINKCLYYKNLLFVNRNGLTKFNLNINFQEYLKAFEDINFILKHFEKAQKQKVEKDVENLENLIKKLTEFQVNLLIENPPFKTFYNYIFNSIQSIFKNQNYFFENKDINLPFRICNLNSSNNQYANTNILDNLKQLIFDLQVITKLEKEEVLNLNFIYVLKIITVFDVLNFECSKNNNKTKEINEKLSSENLLILSNQENVDNQWKIQNTEDFLKALKIIKEFNLEKESIK